MTCSASSSCDCGAEYSKQQLGRLEWAGLCQVSAESCDDAGMVCCEHPHVGFDVVLMLIVVLMLVYFYYYAPQVLRRQTHTHTLLVDGLYPTSDAVFGRFDLATLLLLPHLTMFVCFV